MPYFYPMQRKVQLHGIRYDEKSSFLQGPAKAPPLIRKAVASPSANRFSENGIEVSDLLIDDCGDFTPQDYFEIRERTAALLEKDLPLITLGGDHSISYPVLQAFHEKYGPLKIVHFDAHGDLYEDFEGDPHSHACPFARVLEEGLCTELLQVGLRTLTPSQRNMAVKYGVQQLEMRNLPKQLPGWDGPIYISLDIDVLDPAFAPGVSHHEPGGMSTRELLDYLHQLKNPILGADLVEYNPDRDQDGVTAMVAAKLLKELIALCL